MFSLRAVFHPLFAWTRRTRCAKDHWLFVISITHKSTRPENPITRREVWTAKSLYCLNSNTAFDHHTVQPFCSLFQFGLGELFNKWTEVLGRGEQGRLNTFNGRKARYGSYLEDNGLVIFLEIKGKHISVFQRATTQAQDIYCFPEELDLKETKQWCRYTRSYTPLSRYSCSSLSFIKNIIKHTTGKNKPSLVSAPVFRVTDQSTVKCHHFGLVWWTGKTCPLSSSAIQNLIIIAIFKLMVLRDTLVYESGNWSTY